MSASPIYLDYAATTPVDPRVREVMLRYLGSEDDFGNAASAHAHGRAALAAVEQARGELAMLIGAETEEIIWTSGATEANNLAIQGAARFDRKRRHIVTVKTEHKSVVDCCRQMEKDGWRVTWLKPKTDGLVDLAELEAALADDTLLVSVMHVNNEIGVIQDIAAIGRLARARGITFLVDTTQALGKLPIDLRTLDVDLMSFSAHKVYGPKGVGALYVRRRPRARLGPLLHGGGHERGLRSGTLATHQIAGFGEACRVARAEMEAQAPRLQKLRERLWTGLQALPEIWLNGHDTRRVAGILNVSFGGVDGEALLADLPGLSVATGSACTSANAEPSYVLRALGRSDELAQASLRFSMGRQTTEAEIDDAVAQVIRAVERLRALSPRWRERVPAPLEANVGVARARTPASSAELEVSVRVEGGRIVDARFLAHGCPSTIAAGTWLCETVRNRTIEEAEAIDAATIAEALSLAPVKRFCAVLAEDALRGALKNCGIRS